jgi:hypothetical protein
MWRNETLAADVLGGGGDYRLLVQPLPEIHHLFLEPDDFLFQHRHLREQS